MIPGTAERNTQKSSRSAVRRSTPELSAYHWNGVEEQQDGVRDISSTGAFLLTEEAWVPGEIISLTLQRRGPLEGDLERRVRVQARTVRRDSNGVGLSFVFPQGMDLRLSDSPFIEDSTQFEPEDILREFRLAEAIAFLERLSPAAAPQLSPLMREGLSNFRMASAAEIALRAERILALAPDADQMHAPPELVLRIIESGSWADSELMVQHWAGMLATSCSLDGADDSNGTLISLLGQMTSAHMRLLKTACERGSKYYSSIDRLSSRPIRLTARELMETTGSRDLIRIHRDLEYLADLGLMTITVRSVSFSPMQGTDIAATGLGLRLYARCSGHRNAVPSFYRMPTQKALEVDGFQPEETNGTATSIPA
ncbi:MAG: PilZ domain-containing protein [Terracidiphilus sp.]|nr:PilZ domain-containing protein [Terracidiphilus sp.]